MLERLSARAIAIIVGAVILIVGLGLIVHSCDVRRSKGAQSRVERSQAEAAANSAKDAIDTVGNRQAADAADQKVVQETKNDINKQTDAGGVTDAGRRGLCGLASHRNNPECLQHPPSN